MRGIVSGTVLFVSIIVLAGGMAAGEDKPKKPSDEEITKLLPGKWAVDIAEANVKIKGTTQYKKDGTVEGEATIEAGDMKINLTVSGTWKVKDGVVTETVAKSNRPEIIKEGTTTKDTVISIDEKEYKFKGDSGKETTVKRIKE